MLSLWIRKTAGTTQDALEHVERVPDRPGRSKKLAVLIIKLVSIFDKHGQLLFEAELLFTLIALYGLSTSGEVGRLRLYAIWAGAGFADAAKTAGVRLGANAVRRVLTGSLPARIIARAWRQSG